MDCKYSAVCFLVNSLKCATEETIWRNESVPQIHTTYRKINGYVYSTSPPITSTSILVDYTYLGIKRRLWRIINNIFFRFFTGSKNKEEVERRNKTFQVQMNFPNCCDVTDGKHGTAVLSHRFGYEFVCCTRIRVIILFVATELYV
jgi:hypothetical protein